MQFIVISFDEPDFDGSIIRAINDVRNKGLIRLVDALAIVKDDEGDITTLQVSDLSAAEAALAGAAIGGLIGLGTGDLEFAKTAADEGALSFIDNYEFGLLPEDIDAIAEEIPDGGAALIMLVEHPWLIPLRKAVRMQGGVILAQDFLSVETLLDIGDELATFAQLEAEYEDDPFDDFEENEEDE
jgi:uncharacterized membrane protein